MNTVIDQAKAAARKQAFAARKTAYEAGVAGAAQKALKAALAEYAALPMAGYMAIRTEADPMPAMIAHPGPVGVPVILAARQPLVFHRWQPGCAMVEGVFGALVPQNGIGMVPEVLIVPLVGFDARGYRLGYGGGFYDRTLAALRAAGPVQAIGFAFGAQELPEVPVDAFDQPLDAIVTEAGLRRFPR